jgi:hypothetical protein
VPARFIPFFTTLAPDLPAGPAALLRPESLFDQAEAESWVEIVERFALSPS